LGKKSKKRRIGICAYCGCEAILTVDHIPPKTLYPKHLWSQLLKIPSCVPCNGGASKDDEYLRTMIGLSAKGERDEILKPISDAAVRALTNPDAPGFRQSILKGLEQTFILGPGGILVPAIFGDVDLGRFDRVVERIIRAIFFTERGKSLPLNYRVVNYSAEGMKVMPREAAIPLMAFIDSVTEEEPKMIGGPQFLYWSRYEATDPNQSMWVIVIHRHHFFIGWTLKEQDAMVAQ
jgi:hypothetical protein